MFNIFKSTIDMVREFHIKFCHSVKDEPDLSDIELAKFRISLIKEETRELEEALNNNDKLKVLDGLTDLQYVIDGTYIALGYEKLKMKAFREVHRSNMTKDFNGSMKPLKGPNYSPPNLKQFIE